MMLTCIHVFRQLNHVCNRLLNHLTTSHLAATMGEGIKQFKSLMLAAHYAILAKATDIYHTHCRSHITFSILSVHHSLICTLSISIQSTYPYVAIQVQ